jgi:hypothetical protein
VPNREAENALRGSGFLRGRDTDRLARSAGNGGLAAVSNLPIVTTDPLTLTFTVVGTSGDFVGTNLTFTTTAIPEPAALGIAAITCAAARLRRKRD